MTNCFTFLFCFSADNRCSVGQPRSHCVGRGSAGVGDDYDAHSRWRRAVVGRRAVARLVGRIEVRWHFERTSQSERRKSYLIELFL